MAFRVGVAAAQTFSFRIRSAAQEVTGSSAASISSLSAMRGRLRDLEARTDDFVDNTMSLKHRCLKGWA